MSEKSVRFLQLIPSSCYQTGHEISNFQILDCEGGWPADAGTTGGSDPLQGAAGST